MGRTVTVLPGMNPGRCRGTARLRSAALLALVFVVDVSCGSRVTPPVTQGSAPEAGDRQAQAMDDSRSVAGGPQSSGDPGSPSSPATAATGRAPTPAAAGQPNGPQRLAPEAVRRSAAAPRPVGDGPVNESPPPPHARDAVGPHTLPTRRPHTFPSGAPPLVLGSIGHYSGPIGPNAVPGLQGAQMWVRFINERGGLNGHKVELVVYDDGADPARHAAQTREAVERRGVVAFLYSMNPVTGWGTHEYLEKKGVPVIGADFADWAYQSPIFFPQATAGFAQRFGTLAAAAVYYKPQGKVKFGTIGCVETEICQLAQRSWAQWAPHVGVQMVYEGRASISQPDFTAECLAARNAGVEVFGLMMDANSVGRIAAACSRQGYRPGYGTPVPGGIIAQFAGDPNLPEFVSASNAFPWFQSGTPATDEFQGALRRYGGKITAQVPVALGWTAGKLLERAASHSGPSPSSRTILEGLWGVKNDDLGGLTQPLTFAENRPLTASTACWFAVVLKNGSWLSPDGFTRHCQSLPEKE